MRGDPGTCFPVGAGFFCGVCVGGGGVGLVGGGLAAGCAVLRWLMLCPVGESSQLGINISFARFGGGCGRGKLKSKYYRTARTFIAPFGWAVEPLREKKNHNFLPLGALVTTSSHTKKEGELATHLLF